MINALDETIKALLKRDLPSALAEQVQISFGTPDDQFPPQSVTLPAIDLFLYDVRENLNLRSNEVYVERRGDGTATLDINLVAAQIKVLPDIIKKQVDRGEGNRLRWKLIVGRPEADLHLLCERRRARKFRKRSPSGPALNE